MTLPRRVLVVEDEPIITMLIEDMLADLGVEMVGPAADVPTAVQFAREGEFEFALLDVNLGGEISFPAAEVLLERGIGFAFLTGYGSSGVRSDLRRHPVLSKPIDPNELELVLHGQSPGASQPTAS
jgi:CheY-like chemotaxis protein